MTKDEAMKLALEALEESVDLVREDYENAKKLYGNYPSRQKRLMALEDGLSKHEQAITAIKQAPDERDIRNAVLDEIAAKIALMPFGDTAASFAVWIKEQKT